jgi:hypothetical protein
MISPIEIITSLTIGTVETVASDEIKVILDIDSPRNIALNSGVPIAFPKINGYVLVPNENGAVVGIIIWLGITQDKYSIRYDKSDSRLVELPFPKRKIIISPIGTLIFDKHEWILERGIYSYPSVGDIVILPTKEQSFFISNSFGPGNRVIIGTHPNSHNSLVAVNPDILFGLHLAVLGNTGSGKSCTLVAIIRAAIESAKQYIIDQPQQINKTFNISTISSDEQLITNSRFIILDPNGEYSRCFNDLGSKLFQIPPVSDKDARRFTLPAWFWNCSEWATVTQASLRTQKPLLHEALRMLRSNAHITNSMETRLIVRCKTIKVFLMQYDGKGASSGRDSNLFADELKRLIVDLKVYSGSLTGLINQKIEESIILFEYILSQKIWKWKGKTGYNGFADCEILQVREKVDGLLNCYPEQNIETEINADYPVNFDLNLLADTVAILANSQGDNVSQYISTLALRIKALLSDPRIKNIINPDGTQISLEGWLDNFLGPNNTRKEAVTVIDLSFVPTEIIHLVVGIFSRLIFESLQHYRKLNQTILPTVIVLEEAHRFLTKNQNKSDEIESQADMCRGIFEKIAREGRKFGLGLVLSSQRPSELSETVLSQCNTFLIHRINNDVDQKLISRLVPDNLRGLLKELPSLPTGHCILLGSATTIPTLVEVKHLLNNQTPESQNPDFWNVWTFQNSREINWSLISDEWIGSTGVHKQSIETEEEMSDDGYEEYCADLFDDFHDNCDKDRDDK